LLLYRLFEYWLLGIRLMSSHSRPCHRCPGDRQILLTFGFVPDGSVINLCWQSCFNIGVYFGPQSDDIPESGILCENGGCGGPGGRPIPGSDKTLEGNILLGEGQFLFNLRNLRVFRSNATPLDKGATHLVEVIDGQRLL
jgi:hypothetical protein